MFTRLGRAVVRHPVRVLVLWLVVIAGLIVGGGAILGPDGTGAVTDTKPTDFLPSRYESVQAAKDGEGVDQLVQYGMIIVIFTLMLLLFRSPLLAIINVALIAAVGQGVVMALAVAAKIWHFGLDSDVTGLLPVVLFGVGTDYVV